jgi:preprotein translocase subunit YajC
MNFDLVMAMFAFAPPAQPGQPQPPIWVNLMPLVLMVVIFYFLLIRPQSKKAQELAQLVQSLKAGDKVLLTGGMLATIVTVRDKSLAVRSEDSKFEVLKSAVQEVTERAGEPAKAKS